MKTKYQSCFAIKYLVLLLVVFFFACNKTNTQNIQRIDSPYKVLFLEQDIPTSGITDDSYRVSYLDLNKGVKTTLTEDYFFTYSANFSNDGKNALFISAREGSREELYILGNSAKCQTYTVPIMGGEIKKYNTKSFESSDNILQTPDGQIYITSFRGEILDLNHNNKPVYSTNDKGASITDIVYDSLNSSFILFTSKMPLETMKKTSTIRVLDKNRDERILYSTESFIDCAGIIGDKIYFTEDNKLFSASYTEGYKIKLLDSLYIKTTEKMFNWECKMISDKDLLIIMPSGRYRVDIFHYSIDTRKLTRITSDSNHKRGMVVFKSN